MVLVGFRYLMAAFGGLTGWGVSAKGLCFWFPVRFNTKVSTDSGVRVSLPTRLEV